MRTAKTVATVLLPMCVVACSMDGGTSIASRKIVPDPGGGVYLGTFTLSDTLFEEAIGRDVSLHNETCPGITTIVRDGEEVHRLPAVDIGCLQAEIDQGKILKLGIEPWFCRTNAAAFTVQDVIDGKIDAELRAVARSLAEWGQPVFWGYSVEPYVQWPGHGPDGQQCRWQCDEIEGFPGGVCDDTPGVDPPEHFTQYGDPAKLDSIERYIDFHRKVHDVMEEEIASRGLESNITYVAGHGVSDVDGRHTYVDYWLGADYVDWHTFGLYPGANILPGGSADTCPSFPGELDAWNQVLQLADRPVMLDEFGVVKESYGTPTCTDRAAWFADFFDDLVTRYPQVRALHYVQSDLELWDTAIRPEDPAARAWRSELAARPERWPSCVTSADGSTVCR